MRSPEEARIRKLEERNEDLRGAIEEVVDVLDHDMVNPARIRRALDILEPYDLRSESGAKEER